MFVINASGSPFFSTFLKIGFFGNVDITSSVKEVSTFKTEESASKAMYKYEKKFKKLLRYPDEQGLKVISLDEAVRLEKLYREAWAAGVYEGILRLRSITEL